MRSVRTMGCAAMIAAALGSTQAIGQVPSKDFSAPTSARDLYLGCSLLIRDEVLAEERVQGGPQKPYSALSCAATALVAIGYENGIKPGNEWAYCMPRNASTSTGANKQKTMAMTYVDFYERLGRAQPEMNGLTMMLYAFKDTWPCK